MEGHRDREDMGRHGMWGDSGVHRGTRGTWGTWEVGVPYECCFSCAANHCRVLSGEPRAAPQLYQLRQRSSKASHFSQPLVLGSPRPPACNPGRACLRSGGTSLWGAAFSTTETWGPALEPALPYPSRASVHWVPPGCLSTHAS